MTTIIGCFRYNAVLVHILNDIELAPNAIARLDTDGFTDMEIQSLQYKLNVKGVKAYLQSVRQCNLSTLILLEWNIILTKYYLFINKSLILRSS